MTHGRGMLLFILALAALPSSAAAADSRLGAPPADEVVPGEVIVQYRSGASSSDRAQTRSLAAATVKRDLLLPRTELVSVRTGDEQAAAARLSRDRNVVYAEPNRILHAQGTPNDPRYGELWGLHNTTQAVNGATGVRDADIDAPEAWNLGASLISSVRVAVVDSGVARTHPDLLPNMFTNPGESAGSNETNGIDDDGNGFIDDYRGWDFINNDNNPDDDNHHGTHVAGTIAARTNNSIGISGVAAFQRTTGIWFGPKIVAIKVLAANGSGSIAAIADGLVYAGTIGAKIANVSLGGAGTSTTLDNAIKSKPGTLYAVAAGNDGVNNDTSPHTPCNPATTPDAANKICVAATDSSDVLAGFSNFGVVNVDLAAPGVNILSTTPLTPAFSDNFETSITGRWTTNDTGQSGTPRWARTTLFSTSPSNSITDSPGGTATAPTPYVVNQNNWARNTTGFNLTGLTGCKVNMQANIDTEPDFDFFRVESTRTPTVAASWQSIFTFSGAGQGTIDANLPAAFNGQTGVFVRLRLTSDSSIQGDGAYIDDFKVTCFDPTPSSYEFLNGTSMATPHVAGAATFLATKFPTASVATLKDKIMRSVDKKTALNGRVLTGGRLNLYKATAESTASVSAGVLRWTAPAGQKNLVTVTRFTDTDGIAKYRVTDLYSTSTITPQGGSRIIPGTGCSRISDTTVKCPVAGITRIILTGNDLDDTLSASTITIPVTLDGGAGLDSLTGGTAGDSLIGGTGADRFTAGGGSDTISARNEDVDTLFSCGESTGDSDTVNADLSPNDPVTASSAGCEVVNKL